jgi:hypothetical protein
MTFHFKRDMRYPTPAKTKADRERLVRANRSHAALVYNGADIAGGVNSDLLPSCRREGEGTVS